MIQAGLRGIGEKLELPPAADLNLYQAGRDTLSRFRRLPQDRAAAVQAAEESEFIRAVVPAAVAAEYYKGR